MLIAHYAARAEAFFKALVDHGVADKVLWRTTTYPAFLYTQFVRNKWGHRRPEWTYLCETQHVRVDLVAAMNAAIMEIAKEYKVAVWDISDMSLAQKARDFNDILHPTLEYAVTWALILATYDGFS